MPAPKAPTAPKAPAPAIARSTPPPSSPADSLLAPLPGPAAPSTPPPVEPSPPPAAPPTPAPEAPTGPGNVADFVPSALDLSDVDGPGLPPAPPKPEVTPPPAAPKESAEEIERKRVENQSMREQIADTNRKREAAEQEREQVRVRAETAERERDEIRTREQQAREELETFRKTVGAIDPMKDEKIMALNSQFDTTVNQLAEDISMDGGKGTELRGMIPNMLKQFRSLGKAGSEGYEEKRDALNSTIEEHFPDHSRDVRRLLANGVQMQDQLVSRVNELSKNGEKIRLERQAEEYKSVESAYRKREETFFNPSPDVVENDPFNSEVICSKLLEGSDQTKAAKKQILEFARAYALPLPPVDPDQLAKMTAVEQQTFFGNRQAAQIDRHQRVQAMLPGALASMVLLPGIYKRMWEAEKQLADLRGDSPPPANGDPGPSEDDEPKKLTEFQPKNDSLAEFNKG